MSDDLMKSGLDPVRAAQLKARAELPKRFYRDVAVVPAGAGYEIRLDARPLKTPAKAALILDDDNIAEAIAAEWAAQGDTIDPATMPLTRLANSAIDGVRGREESVADDIAAYAGTDLVCYRADHPEGLCTRQDTTWNPVVAWAEARFGARPVLIAGIMHADQPEPLLAGIRTELAGEGAFTLAALHTVTTITGSALLALALRAEAFDADTVWTAAHVDEDWQIAQWGEDAEAMDRRARRRRDFNAAAFVLETLKD